MSIGKESIFLRSLSLRVVKARVPSIKTVEIPAPTDASVKATSTASRLTNIAAEIREYAPDNTTTANNLCVLTTNIAIRANKETKNNDWRQNLRGAILLANNKGDVRKRDRIMLESILDLHEDIKLDDVSEVEKDIARYNTEIGKSRKFEEANFARISGEVARQQSRLAQLGTLASTGTSLLTMSRFSSPNNTSFGPRSMGSAQGGAGGRPY